MTRPETRASQILMAGLALLVVIQGAALYGRRLPGLAGEAIETMANRDLNREGREALNAGYYEGLINEGERIGGMNRLVTNSRKFTIEVPDQPDRESVREFVYYRLKKNSDIPDYEDHRARYRLKTNSDGLADREYSRAKPAGTRRIALVGDSITRGQGAPFQENYEALLEQYLTEERSRDGRGPIEIINFGVNAYSAMQMMDVALSRAPDYDPDVYVVALTDRSVYRAWSRHLAQLLQSGIDLKYDYLRDVVVRAGVTKDDSLGVYDAKMARYRIPTIRWVLESVRDHARARGATMVVLLMPAVDDPEDLNEEFLGVKPVIDELGIPYLDLLDTFANPDDRPRLRVHDKDRHPNREGHLVLVDAIKRKLAASPQVREAIHGPTGVPPSAGGTR